MNIKKLIIGISLFSIALLAFTFYSGSARADDERGNDRRENRHEDNNNNGRNFNPDKQLSKSACGNNLGNPVINVTQKVQNDVDSGFAGNWAFDYYTRHITVWSTGIADAYCAIVTYDGNFYAVPGQVGPGNNPAGALINTPTNAPVNGNMSGGYRATITGPLLAVPLWSTNGNIGTTNYQCDLSGTCPGRISWTGQYFVSGNTFTYGWWGWQYKGGSHGTWTNAIDVLQPASGNIL